MARNSTPSGEPAYKTSSRACVELCSDDSSSDELVGRPLFLYRCCPAHVDPPHLPMSFGELSEMACTRCVRISSSFPRFNVTRFSGPVADASAPSHTAPRSTTCFLLQDPSQHRGTRSTVAVVVSLMSRPSSRCLHLPAHRECHSAQQMTCHEDAAACTRHQVAVCPPDTPGAISTSCGRTIWCTSVCGAASSVVLVSVPWPSSGGGSKGVLDEAVAPELDAVHSSQIQDREFLPWISKRRSSIRNHALRDVLFSAVTIVEHGFGAFVFVIEFPKHANHLSEHFDVSLFKCRPSSQTWTPLGSLQRQNRMFVSSTKLGEPQAHVPTI